MNRYKLPLRFTILWAVNMAVIVVLELIYGFSEKLPFAQRDLESIYCVVGGLLAALELTLWNWIAEKRKNDDPWEN